MTTSLARDALVTQEFAKPELRFGEARSSNRRIDAEAYAKGFAAGAPVNISGEAYAMAKPTSQSMHLGRT